MNAITLPTMIDNATIDLDSMSLEQLTLLRYKIDNTINARTSPPVDISPSLNVEASPKKRLTVDKAKYGRFYYLHGKFKSNLLRYDEEDEYDLLVKEFKGSKILRR